LEKAPYPLKLGGVPKYAGKKKKPVDTISTTVKGTVLWKREEVLARSPSRGTGHCLQKRARGAVGLGVGVVEDHGKKELRAKGGFKAKAA